MLWFVVGLCLSCCDGSESGRTISTAFDEVRWTESNASPLLVPGPPGAWNETKADTGDSLLFREDHWLLFHSGQDISAINSIGLHVSVGLALEGPWADFLNAPVLRGGGPGQWDEFGVAHPSVLDINGSTLMFHTGFGSAGEQIGLAVSADGTSFVKHAASPILVPGPSGEWDSAGVDHPSVIYDGSRYVMAYRGWAAESGFTDIHSQIGIATSEDGLIWTKSLANPVLRFAPPGAWDDYGLLAPRLWYESGTYFMNYSGKTASDPNLLSSIGHATAKDLDRWVKSSKNPIIYSGNTRWTEIEWGTNVRLANTWYMFTPAWFETGRTVLWTGAFE